MGGQLFRCGKLYDVLVYGIKRLFRVIDDTGFFDKIIHIPAPEMARISRIYASMTT